MSIKRLSLALLWSTCLANRLDTYVWRVPADSIVQQEGAAEQEDAQQEQATEANFAMQGWGSHEHMNLGDVAFKRFYDQPGMREWDLNVAALLDTFNNKHDEAAYLSNKDPLHFGDFILLSGDYYADMHRKSKNGKVEYKGPGVQLDMEKWGLGKYSGSESSGHHDFHTLYQDFDAGLDKDPIIGLTIQGLLKYFRDLSWNKAEGENFAVLTAFYPDWLAATAANYNHFGKTAQAEFEKAHAEARNYAYEAGQMKQSGADPGCLDRVGSCRVHACDEYRKTIGCRWDWWGGARFCQCGNKYGKKTCIMGGQCRPSLDAWTGKLQRAIEVLAMGLHFYTDQFAAGHIRVPYSGGEDPENTLYGKCGGSHALGLTTKCMHGEENKVGVHVKNELNQEWTMYGDGMWFERKDGSDPNEKNREVAINGTVAALNDLWEAFADGVEGKQQSKSALGESTSRDPLAYLGSPTDEAFPPMLKVENGEIKFRETPAKTQPPIYVNFECPSGWGGYKVSAEQCSYLGVRNDLP